VAVRGKRPTHCPVGGDGAGRQGKPSHSHGFSTPNPGSRRFVFACWVDWFVIRNDRANFKAKFFSASVIAHELPDVLDRIELGRFLDWKLSANFLLPVTAGRTLSAKAFEFAMVKGRLPGLNGPIIQIESRRPAQGCRAAFWRLSGPESRVLRSSGSRALDEESLALLLRAEPIPEMQGERVDLIVPIRFNLLKSNEEYGLGQFSNDSRMIRAKGHAMARYIFQAGLYVVRTFRTICGSVYRLDLAELGWIDGRDIAIEYRWAEGRDDGHRSKAPR
jgi:hypothetical protein